MGAFNENLFTLAFTLGFVAVWKVRVFNDLEILLMMAECCEQVVGSDTITRCIMTNK